MQCMSKKKPKPAKDKPARVGDTAVSLFVADEIVQALTEHIQKQARDAKPTKRSVWETAMIEYLTKRGSWPLESKTTPPAASS